MRKQTKQQSDIWGKQQVAQLFFEEATRQNMPPQSIFAWMYLMNLEGGSPYAVTVEGNKTRSYGPWQINDARAQALRSMGIDFPSGIYATRDMPEEEVRKRMLNHIRYIINYDKQVRENLKKLNPQLYDAVFKTDFSKIDLKTLSHLISYYMASWNAPAYAKAVAKGDFRPLIPGQGVYRLASLQRRREAFQQTVSMWSEITGSFMRRQMQQQEEALRETISAALRGRRVTLRTGRAPSTISVPQEQIHQAMMPGLVSVMQTLPSVTRAISPQMATKIRREFPEAEGLIPPDEKQPQDYIAALSLIGEVAKQDSAFANIWHTMDTSKRQSILRHIVSAARKISQAKTPQEAEQTRIKSIMEIAKMLGVSGLWEEAKKAGKSIWDIVSGFATGAVKELGFFVSPFVVGAKREEWAKLMQEIRNTHDRSKNRLDKLASRIAYDAVNNNPAVTLVWGGIVKGFAHMVSSLIAIPELVTRPFLPKDSKVREFMQRALVKLDEIFGPKIVSESAKLAKDPEFRRQNLKDAVNFFASNGWSNYLKLVNGRYVPTEEGWYIFASMVLQSKVGEILNDALRRATNDHWAFRNFAENNLYEYRNLAPLIPFGVVPKALSVGRQLLRGVASATRAQRIPAAVSALAETGNLEAAIQLSRGVAALNARQRLLDNLLSTFEVAILPGKAFEGFFTRTALNWQLRKMGISQGIKGLEEIARTVGTEAALDILKQVAPKVSGFSKVATSLVTGVAFTLPGMPSHLSGGELTGHIIGGTLVNMLLDIPNLYRGTVEYFKGNKMLPHEILSQPNFARTIASIYEYGFVKQTMQDPTSFQGFIAGEIRHALRGIQDMNALSRRATAPKLGQLLWALNIPTEDDLRTSKQIMTKFATALEALPEKEKKIVSQLVEAYRIFEDTKRDMRQKYNVPEGEFMPENMTIAQWEDIISGEYVKRLVSHKVFGKDKLDIRDIARANIGLHILTHARWFGEYFYENNTQAATQMFSVMLRAGLVALERSLEGVRDVPVETAEEALKAYRTIRDRALRTFYRGFPVVTDLMKSLLAHKLTLLTAAGIAKAGGASRESDVELEARVSAGLRNLDKIFLSNLPEYLGRHLQGEARDDIVKRWTETIEPVMQAEVESVVSPSQILEVAKNVVRERYHRIRPTAEEAKYGWRKMIRDFDALYAAWKAQQAARAGDEESPTVQKVADMDVYGFGADWSRAEKALERFYPKRDFSHWGEDYIPATVVDAENMVVGRVVDDEWRNAFVLATRVYHEGRRESLSDEAIQHNADETRYMWDAMVTSYALSFVMHSEISKMYLGEDSPFPMMFAVSPDVAERIRNTPHVSSKFNVVAVDIGTPGRRSATETDDVILIMGNKDVWSQERLREFGRVIRDVFWRERIPKEFWDFVLDFWSKVDVLDIPLHIRMLFASLMYAEPETPLGKRMGVTPEVLDAFSEFFRRNLKWWELFIPQIENYMNKSRDKIMENIRKYTEDAPVVNAVSAIRVARFAGFPHLDNILGAAMLISFIPSFLTTHAKIFHSPAYFLVKNLLPDTRTGDLSETVYAIRSQVLLPFLRSYLADDVELRNGDWMVEWSEDGRKVRIQIPEEEEALFWVYYVSRLQSLMNLYDSRYFGVDRTRKDIAELFAVTPSSVFADFLSLRAPDKQFSNIAGRIREREKEKTERRTIRTQTTAYQSIAAVPWAEPEIVVNVVKNRHSRLMSVVSERLKDPEVLRMASEISGLGDPAEIERWISDNMLKLLIVGTMAPTAYYLGPTVDLSFAGVYTATIFDLPSSSVRSFVWLKDLDKMLDETSVHELLHILTYKTLLPEKRLREAAAELSEEDRQKAVAFTLELADTLIRRGYLGAKVAAALIFNTKEITGDVILFPEKFPRNLSFGLLSELEDISQNINALLEEFNLSSVPEIVRPLTDAISEIQEILEMTTKRLSREKKASLVIQLVNKIWDVGFRISRGEVINEEVFARLSDPNLGGDPIRMMQFRNRLNEMLNTDFATISDFAADVIGVSRVPLWSFIVDYLGVREDFEHFLGIEKEFPTTEVISYVASTFAEELKSVASQHPEEFASFVKLISRVYSDANIPITDFMKLLFPAQMTAEMFDSAVHTVKVEFGDLVSNPNDITRAVFLVSSLLGDTFTRIVNPYPDIIEAIINDGVTKAIWGNIAPGRFAPELSEVEAVALSERPTIEKYWDIVSKAFEPISKVEKEVSLAKAERDLIIASVTSPRKFAKFTQEEIERLIQIASQVQTDIETAPKGEEFVKLVNEFMKRMQTRVAREGQVVTTTFHDFLSNFVSETPIDASYLDVVLGIASQKSAEDPMGAFIVQNENFSDIVRLSTHLSREIVMLFANMDKITPIRDAMQFLTEGTKGWGRNLYHSLAAVTGSFWGLLEEILTQPDLMRVKRFLDNFGAPKEWTEERVVSLIFRKFFDTVEGTAIAYADDLLTKMEEANVFGRKLTEKEREAYRRNFANAIVVDFFTFAYGKNISRSVVENINALNISLTNRLRVSPFRSTSVMADSSGIPHITPGAFDVLLANFGGAWDEFVNQIYTLNDHSMIEKATEDFAGKYRKINPVPESKINPFGQMFAMLVRNYIEASSVERPAIEPVDRWREEISRIVETTTVPDALYLSKVPANIVPLFAGFRNAVGEAFGFWKRKRAEAGLLKEGTYFDIMSMQPPDTFPSVFRGVIDLDETYRITSESPSLFLAVLHERMSQYISSPVTTRHFPEFADILTKQVPEIHDAFARRFSERLSTVMKTKFQRRLEQALGERRGLQEFGEPWQSSALAEMSKPEFEGVKSEAASVIFNLVRNQAVRVADKYIAHVKSGSPFDLFSAFEEFNGRQVLGVLKEQFPLVSLLVSLEPEILEDVKGLFKFLVVYKTFDKFLQEHPRFGETKQAWRETLFIEPSWREILIGELGEHRDFTAALNVKPPVPHREFMNRVTSAFRSADWLNPEDINWRHVAEFIDALWHYSEMKSLSEYGEREGRLDPLAKLSSIYRAIGVVVDDLYRHGFISTQQKRKAAELSKGVFEELTGEIRERLARGQRVEDVQLIRIDKLMDLFNELGETTFKNAVLRMSKLARTSRDIDDVFRGRMADVTTLSRMRYLTPELFGLATEIFKSYGLVYRNLSGELGRGLRKPETVYKHLMFAVSRGMESILNRLDVVGDFDKKRVAIQALVAPYDAVLRYFDEQFRELSERYAKREDAGEVTLTEEEAREYSLLVRALSEQLMAALRDIPKAFGVLQQFYELEKRQFRNVAYTIDTLVEILSTHTEEIPPLNPKAKKRILDLLREIRDMDEVGEVDKDIINIAIQSLGEGYYESFLVGMDLQGAIKRYQKLTGKDLSGQTPDFLLRVAEHYSRLLEQLQQYRKQAEENPQMKPVEYWDREISKADALLAELLDRDMTRPGIRHLSPEVQQLPQMIEILDILSTHYIMNTLGRRLEETMAMIPKQARDAIFSSFEKLVTISEGDEVNLSFLHRRQKGGALTRFLVGLSLVGTLAAAIPALPELATRVFPALAADIGRGVAQMVHLAMTDPMWVAGIAAGVLSYALAKKRTSISKVLSGILIGVSNWMRTHIPRLNQIYSQLSTEIVNKIRTQLGDTAAGLAAAILPLMSPHDAFDIATLPFLVNHISKLTYQGTFPGSGRPSRELAEQLINFSFAQAILGQGAVLGAHISNLAHATETYLITRHALPKFLQDPARSDAVVLNLAVLKALSLLSKHGIEALDKPFREFYKRSPIRLASAIVNDPMTGQPTRFSLTTDTATINVGGQRVALDDMTLRQVLELGLRGFVSQEDMNALFNATPKKFKDMLTKIRDNHLAELKRRIYAGLMAHATDEDTQAIRFVSSYLLPVARGLLLPAKEPHLAAAMTTYGEVQAAYLMNLRYLQHILSLPYAQQLLQPLGIDANEIVSEIDRVWNGLRSAGISARVLEDVDRAMSSVREITEKTIKETKGLTPQNVWKRVRDALEEAQKVVGKVMAELIHTRYTPLLKGVKGKRLATTLGYPFLALEADMRAEVVKLFKEPFNQEAFSVATSTFPDEVVNLDVVANLERLLASGRLTPMQLFDVFEKRIVGVLNELAKASHIKFEDLNADFNRILFTLYTNSHRDIDPTERVSSMSDIFSKRLVDLNHAEIFDPSSPVPPEVGRLRDELEKLAWSYVVLLNYLVKTHSMKAYLGDLLLGLPPSFALTEERYVPQWGDETLEPWNAVVKLITHSFERLPQRAPRQRFQFRRTGRGRVPAPDFRDFMRRSLFAFTTKQVLDKHRPLIEGVIGFMPPPFKQLMAYQLANALAPLRVSGSPRVPLNFEVGESVASAIQDMFSAVGEYHKAVMGGLSERRRGVFERLLGAYQTQTLIWQIRSPLRQVGALIYAGAALYRDFGDMFAAILPTLFFPRAVKIILDTMRGDLSGLNDFERVVLENSPELWSRRMVTEREFLADARAVIEDMMSHPRGQEAMNILLDPAASAADKQKALSMLQEIYILGADPNFLNRAWRNITKWGFAALRLMDEAAVLATKLAAVAAYVAHNDVTGQFDVKDLPGALHYSSALSERVHSTPLEGYRPALFRGGEGSVWRKVLFMPQVFSQFLVYTFAASEQVRIMLGDIWDGMTRKDLSLKDRAADIAAGISALVLLQLGAAIMNGSLVGLTQRPLEEQPLGVYSREEEEKNLADAAMSMSMEITKSALPKPVTFLASYALNLLPLRSMLLKKTLLGTVTERDLPPALQLGYRVLSTVVNTLSSLGYMAGAEEGEETNRLQSVLDAMLVSSPREQIWSIATDLAQITLLLASLRFPQLGSVPVGMIAPATRALTMGEEMPVPVEVTTTMAGRPVAARATQAMFGIPSPHGYSELLSPGPADYAFRSGERNPQQMAFRFIDATERSTIPAYVSELMRVARTVRIGPTLTALKHLIDPAFYLSISEPSRFQVIPHYVSENHPVVVSVRKLFNTLKAPSEEKFITYVASNPIDFAWLSVMWGYNDIMDRWVQGSTKPDWHKQYKDLNILSAALASYGVRPEVVSALVSILEQSNEHNLREFMNRHIVRLREQEAAKKVLRGQKLGVGRRGE